MTIAEQAKFLLDALRDWAKAAGGRAFVASDAIDCIEQLRMKPGRPAAAVLWVNEEPRDMDVLGRVDRLFKVIVSRGKSLKVQPGESLTEGAASGGPMFDLVEQVREVLLALRLPDESEGGPAFGPVGEDTIPGYRGSGPFEVNGLMLDAVEVRVSLPAQITVQAEAGEGG